MGIGFLQEHGFCQEWWLVPYRYSYMPSTAIWILVAKPGLHLPYLEHLLQVYTGFLTDTVEYLPPD